MQLSRRQFIVGLAAAVTAACSAPAYARWIEPRWLRISRMSLPLFPNGTHRRLRILHLSDFHLSRVVPLSFIKRAMRMGMEERPDVGVLTGDFITRELRQRDPYVDALRELTERMPVYAVLGNHDGGHWARARGGYPDTATVRALLEHGRVRLLHNETETVRVGETAVQLIGLGDLWARELDAKQAFRPDRSTSALPRIVLAHNPDSKDLLGDESWDVMLSGHTHGGQISLPFVGAPMAPVQDHRYVEGLNRWRDRWIYTTRGVGNLHGIRFNCRPEISVLDVM